jgi:hypothetical protein
MLAASFVTLSTKASCSMANPRRAKSLLELAEEDLVGARLLLGVSTRLARYPCPVMRRKGREGAFQAPQFESRPGTPFRSTC